MQNDIIRNIALATNPYVNFVLGTGTGQQGAGTYTFTFLDKVLHRAPQMFVAPVGSGLKMQINLSSVPTGGGGSISLSENGWMCNIDPPAYCIDMNTADLPTMVGLEASVTSWVNREVELHYHYYGTGWTPWTNASQTEAIARTSKVVGSYFKMSLMLHEQTYISSIEVSAL